MKQETNETNEGTAAATCTEKPGHAGCTCNNDALPKRTLYSNKISDRVLRLANDSAWRLEGQRKTVESSMGSSLFNYARQQVENVKPFFGVSVILGLTNHCQCKCIHCGAASLAEDPRQELKREEILALTDELSRLGAFQLYLFGGEPLMVRDVVDYVRYARQRGLIVSLDSNGILLDDWMARKLKGAGINRVRVSIDSVDPGKHDELRGKKGVFDKAVDAFQHCKNHGIECHLSTYTTKENLANGELEKVLAFAKNLGVKVRLLTAIRSGLWADRDEVVLSKDEIQRMKQLLSPQHVYWEVEMSDSPEKSLFCPVKNRRLLYVNPYGDVNPCCYVAANFGNVREESIEAIAKKMWKPDMFCQNSGCGDCVANDKEFMEKLHEWQHESTDTKGN